MSDQTLVGDETIENKNKNKVRCQFCNSLILKEHKAEYIRHQFDLPLMHQKNTKDVASIETETQYDFWLVDDMYTFENIGFSNTIGKTKYLICADCDMGPVGFHDIDNKKCYVALKRVRHGVNENEAPIAIANH